MSLFAGLEEILIENEPLSTHTWFKIGGPARYFLKPRNKRQLQTIISRCRENDFPWRILGHGANLLVDDAGLNCAVISLDHKAFGEMEFSDKRCAKVGAAASLGGFVIESVRAGFSGAEVLVGIPGTVGGAVKINAGGRFGDIGTLVSSATVLDGSGEIFGRERGDLSFEYRNSNIGEQIITEVELELVPDDPMRVLNKMREVWIIKKSSQPLVSRSAGCIFKNPSPDKPAGVLIDKAGLKGASVGGATISEQHANFITAEAGTRFSDVISLIELIREKVKDAFDITLELEIEIWTD